MRFSQLEVFCTIYKHNSVTKASENLVVTQPAISVQLRSLERELGVQLFERVGRNIRPTPAGDMLYKYASNVLNLIKEAEINLEQFRLGLSGQVVLGVATGIVYCIPGLLGDFQRLFPKVKLVLQTDIADRIREMTVQDSVDFGLLWGPVTDARLESKVLTQHEYVIVTPAGHSLAQCSDIEPELLNQHSLVMPPPETSTRQYVEGMLRGLGIAPKIAVELPTTDAMKWAVVAGLGVSFISLPAASLEISAGILKPVRIKGQQFNRSIEMIYPKRQMDSAVMSRFKDYVINSPYWKNNETTVYQSK